MNQLKHLKTFSLRATMTLLMMVLTATTAWAQETKQDGNWTYKDYGDYAIISAYTGSDKTTLTSLNFPRQLGGKEVMGISSSFHFSDFTNLQTLNFYRYAGIKEMPSVKNCSKLAHINVINDNGTIYGKDGIPEFMFIIPGNCFQGTLVQKVILGIVSSMGSNVFKDSNSLSRVEILPQSSGSIEDGAFSYIQSSCVIIDMQSSRIDWSWQKIAFSPNLYVWCLDGGIGWCGDGNVSAQDFLYWTMDESGNLTIACAGDGWGNSQDKQIIKSHCWNDYVTSTGKTIKSITLSQVYALGADEFKGMTSVTSVTLNDGLTSIGASAFEGCTGLTSITIPASVTSIGADAFKGCTNLTTVTIQGNPTIAAGAFPSGATVNMNGTTQLVCRWTPQDGGTVTVDNGTQVTATPANGYYVNKVIWYETDPDLGGEVGSFVELNVNGMGYYKAPQPYGYVVVTFKPCSNNVRVRFNMNGHGDAIDDQDLHLGETVTQPDDPTEDGYIFLDWCTNSNCTKPYNFNTVLDNTLKYDTHNDRYNLTLYALWVAETDLSGTCGTKVTWAVSKSAGSDNYDVLTISGSGAMADDSSGPAPWYNFRNLIKTIVIKEGVTAIGRDAFPNFVNVTSDITIPASVTSIGMHSFSGVSRNTTAGIHITAAEGSQLASLGESAFNGANASIDLSPCTHLTAISNTNVFNAVTKDVTLPSSVTSICQWAFGRYSDLHFSGDHVYVVVPDGKALSVTIDGVTEPVVIEPTDGKADILACLYADPANRKASRALTLALVDKEPPVVTTYAITTDGNCEAYYIDLLTPVIVTEAEEGKELSIRIKEGAQPAAGKYFTGEFTVNGTSLGRDEHSFFISGFTMPAEAVTIAAVQADQTTLTYDLTSTDAQVMPSAAELLFNGDERAHPAYVEEGSYTVYDFDESGTPDMKLYFDDDKEQYYVQRLDGADAKGTFTFTYTEPTDQYGTITFIFPTTPTGIDSIRTTDSDGTEWWYTLDGRRIAKPTRKGVYIHGGRKEVIR